MFPKKTVLGEVEVNRVRVVAEENDNEKAEIGDVAFSIFLFVLLFSAEHVFINHEEQHNEEPYEAYDVPKY